MIMPLTLFLYLAVDAPTQTLMRALFKKCKLKVIPPFLIHNKQVTLVVYSASVENRKIAVSVIDKEIEHPRQHSVEGGEETLVEKLEEIKSSD